MCDTEMLTRWAKDAKAGGLSRRQFGVLGAAGLAAGCTTMGGAVGSLMAGQSVGMVKEEEPAAQIIQRLLEECEGALTRR